MAIFNRNEKAEKKQSKTSIDDIEKRIDRLEKQSEKVLDSYNNLFNVFFMDYDITPKGMLKLSQDICQELLDFVVNVCRKHDIEYWLDYGTLLGPVRHGGFLPWDDDVDIAMMRKDYEKFHSVIKDEIKSHGLDGDIDVLIYKNPSVLFTQIAFNSSTLGKILAALDIFPYDYIKSGAAEDMETEFNEEKKSLKRAIKNGEDPQKVINGYFEKFNVDYERQDRIIGSIENIRCPISKYSYAVLDTDRIFPLDEIEFNGETYACPRDSDYYLKEIYGDYSRMPKLIDTHGRVKILRDIEGSRDELELNISRLRSINDSFK